MRKRLSAVLLHRVLPVYLLLSPAVPPARGQFALESFALASGGSSSGETYELSGAVQQTDAVALTGEGYELTAEFWGFVSTSPPTIPAVRVVRAGAVVTLAWTSLAEGFQLEESSSLTSPDWADVNIAPVLVGQERQVSRVLASTVRFYRLRRL